MRLFAAEGGAMLFEVRSDEGALAARDGLVVLDGESAAIRK